MFRHLGKGTGAFIGLLAALACSSNNAVLGSNVQDAGTDGPGSDGALPTGGTGAAGGGVGGATLPTGGAAVAGTGGAIGAGGSANAGGGVGGGTLPTGGAGGAGTGGAPGEGGSANVGGSAGAEAGGGQPACYDFPDETGTPVEIVVNNARSTPIYVGSRESLCNLKNELSIRDSANNEVPIETDICYTCAEFAAEGACTYSCGRSPLYRVLPGASLTLRWNGTYFVTHQQTAACPLPWPFICPQEKAAPPGTYSVTVTASAEVGCEFSDCSCVITDTCPYPGAAAAYGTGDAYEVSAEIQVPGTTSVSVTFSE
jgi:hypothetical protein